MRRNILGLILMLMFAVSLVGCKSAENTANKAVQNNAVKKTGDAVKGTATKAGEAIKDATTKAGDAVKDATTTAPADK